MSIFDLFKKIESEGKRAPVSYIVAGLGNPGAKYEKTRHNAGFLAIDHMAGKLGEKINSSKFQSLCCRTTVDGTGVLLMKPQTFMNASGIAIDGFPRVRMGVGEKPTPEYDLADWVTGKLPEADMKALQGRFDDVYEAVRLILKGDYDRAMNLYNR